MAKRMFATLIYLAMVMLFAINAQAQPGPISVDGCAKLARVIYSEVSSAAMYGPGKAGPWMIEQGQGGQIVNTASIGGFLAGPGLALYCTSKFAVVGLSQSLRAELAPHAVDQHFQVQLPHALDHRLAALRIA